MTAETLGRRPPHCWGDGGADDATPADH